MYQPQGRCSLSIRLVVCLLLQMYQFLTKMRSTAPLAGLKIGKVVMYYCRRRCELKIRFVVVHVECD